MSKPHFRLGRRAPVRAGALLVMATVGALPPALQACGGREEAPAEATPARREYDWRAAQYVD